MQKNKVVAIIQARMGSKRLRGKSLMFVGGRRVIDHVVSRLKAVNVLQKGLISDIVVATSTCKRDNDIAWWCISNKVKCFRGSEKNVLDRMYRCAVEHKADWILRVTGDCPVIEPLMIYGLLKNRYKSYQALAFNERRIPGGWDVELFSIEMLRGEYHRGQEQEHVSKGMRWNNEDKLDKGTDFVFDISLELNTRKDLKLINEYLHAINGQQTGKKVSR
jgi:spore coat polysaccharide biosynthesis protein SpsF